MSNKLSANEMHRLEQWLGLSLNEPLIPDVLGHSGFSALMASAKTAASASPSPDGRNGNPDVTPSGRGKRSKPSHITTSQVPFNSDALGYLSAEEEFFHRHGLDTEAPPQQSLEGAAGIFFAERRRQLITAAGTIAHAVFDTQALNFLRWTRRYALIKHSGSPRKKRPIDQWLLHWEDPEICLWRPPAPHADTSALKAQRHHTRVEFLTQWQDLQQALGLDVKKIPEAYAAKKRVFYEQLWAVDTTHWTDAAFFPAGFPVIAHEALTKLLRLRKDGRLDWDPCKYALTDQFDWITALRNHQPIDDLRYEALKRQHHKTLAAMPEDPIVGQWMEAVQRGEYDPNDDMARARFLKTLGK